MTLEELPIGKRAAITAVGGEGALRCRLLDMGLIPKTAVEVRKVAPMVPPIPKLLINNKIDTATMIQRMTSLVKSSCCCAAVFFFRPVLPFRLVCAFRFPDVLFLFPVAKTY